MELHIPSPSARVHNQTRLYVTLYGLFVFVIVYQMLFHCAVAPLVIKRLSGGTLHSRETHRYKDLLLTIDVTPEQTPSTDDVQDNIDEIDIDDVIAQLGFRQSPRYAMRLISMVGKELRDTNPEENREYVQKKINGSVENVYKYFERDRHTLERVIHRFFSE
jgi:hypothetical protein